MVDITSTRRIDKTEAPRTPKAYLPLDHMSDFEREGLIGECEDTIYSITGYLTHTAVFMQTTAQEVAQRLKDAKEDVSG